jgi:hypothetical protein
MTNAHSRTPNGRQHVRGRAHGLTPAKAREHRLDQAVWVAAGSRALKGGCLGRGEREGGNEGRGCAGRGVLAGAGDDGSKQRLAHGLLTASFHADSQERARSV